MQPEPQQSPAAAGAVLAAGQRSEAGTGGERGALSEVRAVLASDASDKRDPASAVGRGLLALAGGLGSA